MSILCLCFYLYSLSMFQIKPYFRKNLNRNLFGSILFATLLLKKSSQECLCKYSCCGKLVCKLSEIRVSNYTFKLLKNFSSNLPYVCFLNDLLSSLKVSCTGKFTYEDSQLSFLSFS